MCRMKRRYGTEGEAVNSLERSRRFNPAFWNCDLYACPYCHGYHIGTVTKRPVYRYY